MYIPVLKWKMGEKKALENLKDEILNLITPLIEIQPCNSLDDIDELIKKFGEEIVKSWKSTNPFYLDVSNIDECCEDEIQYNISHPISKFIENTRSKGKICIPVISYDSLCNYIPLIQSINPYLKSGIAIRIRRNAFLDADSIIPDILSKMNISPKMTDLIIDLREVTEDDIPSLVISIKSILLSFKDNYRKIILVATGYPTDYPSSFMGSESYKSVARTELSLWHTLKQKVKLDNNIKIEYGDYCCSNSTPMPEDVSFMRPSAIIKYTSENAWHIWRGIRLTRGGHQQYFDLAKMVVDATDIYKGSDYSWGDNQIYLCSRQERSSGNPTTWVQIATNHHITLVAQQFSNQDDS